MSEIWGLLSGRLIIFLGGGRGEALILSEFYGMQKKNSIYSHMNLIQNEGKRI